MVNEIPLSHAACSYFYSGDSAGVNNLTRPEGLTLVGSILTMDNVKIELPRLWTAENIRRFGEAQIDRLIISKMESDLRLQWGNVLEQIKKKKKKKAVSTLIF